MTYRRHTEARFGTSTNLRWVWEGIRAITDFETKPPPSDLGWGPKLLLNPLWQGKYKSCPCPSPLDRSSSRLEHTWSEVCECILDGMNMKKGVQIEYLAGSKKTVLWSWWTSSLFSTPRCRAHWPATKQLLSFPSQKRVNITCLNDYRPVALNTISAKCLEKLVFKYIRAALPRTLNPFQLAYRENQSTADSSHTAGAPRA